MEMKLRARVAVAGAGAMGSAVALSLARVGLDVTIFDPRGNRVASTSTHLERQGALTEASRYVNQLLAKRHAT